MVYRNRIYSFSTEVALYIGDVTAAVLLYDIDYLLCANKANGINYHDGRYWTFKTYHGITERHPYLTKRQARYLLDALCRREILIRAQYSTGQYASVNWYSFHDNIDPNLKMYFNYFGTNEESKLLQNNQVTSVENNYTPPVEEKVKEDEYFTDLLPKELKEEDGFLKAWHEWVDFRKEIKKKLTKTSAKRQITLLSKEPEPIASIDYSIRNGYTGLFPVKLKSFEQLRKDRQNNGTEPTCRYEYTEIPKKPV